MKQISQPTKINNKEYKMFLITLGLIYLLTIAFDWGISYNECLHNSNFYEEELNKGFADICQNNYRGHWISFFLLFFEPLGILCLIYLILFHKGIRGKEVLYSVTVFVFIFKSVKHIIGGLSWTI